MPEAPRTDWPTTIFTRDEDQPEDRYAVVTAMSMGELAHRLEALGARVAASLNRLPDTDRPLLALEITAGPALPTIYRDVDGDDFVVAQRELSWRPTALRFDGVADAYVLSQSLETPSWPAAAGYEVPPLEVVRRQYFVLLLPRQLDTDASFTLHTGLERAPLEIPADVVDRPPHPLLWWGTPPAGHTQ